MGEREEDHEIAPLPAVSVQAGVSRNRLEEKEEQPCLFLLLGLRFMKSDSDSESVLSQLAVSKKVN